jgi:hypothetical protein
LSFASALANSVAVTALSITAAALSFTAAFLLRLNMLSNPLVVWFQEVYRGSDRPNRRAAAFRFVLLHRLPSAGFKSSREF